jgi:hypothetical protein
MVDLGGEFIVHSLWRRSAMWTGTEEVRILGLGGIKTDSGLFGPEALLSIVEG